MVRSIPPVTSTGSSRAIKDRRKPGKPEGPPAPTSRRGQLGTIKIGIGGLRAAPERKERVEPIRSWTFASKPKFTRYPPTQKYVMVEKIKEPVARILQDTSIAEVVVVAHLPGVEEKNIQIELHGDILEIFAQGKDEFGTKKYTKEMLLPFMADSKAIEPSFKNNILEIKLKEKEKRKGKKGKRQLGK